MLRRFSMFCALVALAACNASEADGDGILDGKADDLDPSEIPALAPAYAVEVRSTIGYCTNNDGECEEEPDVSAVEALARLALSQDGASVTGELEVCFAMVTTHKGKRYATDSDVFSEGDPTAFAAPFAVTGQIIGVDGVPTLALDPVNLNLGLDDNLDPVDVDNDGKDGLSIDAPIGRVFLGGQASLERLRVDIEAGLGAAEFGGQLVVFGDTVPLVNVAKKLDKALGELLFPQLDHEVQMFPDDRSCADL